MNTSAQRVLDAIESLSEARPYPPTYREVADLLGWKAHSRVHSIVRSLRKEGLLYDPQSSAARSLLSLRKRGRR